MSKYLATSFMIFVILSVLNNYIKVKLQLSVFNSLLS